VSPPPSQADELLRLAEARFPDLSAPEKKLLGAAAQGDWAQYGPNYDPEDPSNDPSKADAWGSDRSLRAAVVRWLCVDRDAKGCVDPKGIQVHAAKITGPLDLFFVAVPFPLGFYHCRLTDEANLMWADLPALSFDGSWARGIAAEGVRVKGGVYLRNGFSAEGGVRLLGAQIGEALECDKGSFKNPPKEGLGSSGYALAADRINVKGGVFLRNGFSAEGQVRLPGAQIGGNLDCDISSFKNPPQKGLGNSGTALAADGINVKGSVLLRNGFSAEGGVRLLGAQIGGNLECDKGSFKNPPKEGLDSSGTALNADRINVKGGVLLRNGFSAEGQVRLPGAQIAGDLDCHDAALSELTVLDLRSASAGSIIDDKPSWPGPGKLLADGFVYNRISEGPSSAKERLDWLSRQPSARSFAPQPYRQLATVLKQAGDEEGARRVLYEMEDRLWKERNFLSRWTLMLAIGYGYYPLWSLGWLVLLVGLGWITYSTANLAGAISPTEENAYKWFRDHRSPPPYYETFVPLVYSIENSLPLVQLGQAKRWQPDPSPPTLTLPAGKLSRIVRLITSRPFLRCFLWVQIPLGWILATLFVAGVTGILRKD
jgi:sRNA-binding regulator protein Hfq